MTLVFDKRNHKPIIRLISVLHVIKTYDYKMFKWLRATLICTHIPNWLIDCYFIVRQAVVIHIEVHKLWISSCKIQCSWHTLVFKDVVVSAVSPYNVIFNQLKAKFMDHADVIKCKHFPRYWPFVRKIHRTPVDSPHKGQWRGALIFSLIWAWTNGWANNRDVGDLRCHRVHYDVTVRTCRCLRLWGLQCDV